MNTNNFAILELKYGNIYGGFPNFFAIAEISLLAFDPRGNKVFVETWKNGLDVDYVSVYSKVNELGHTVSREKEVINMKTGRTRPFQEEFHLDKTALDFTFRKLKPVHQWVKKFLLTNLKKYEVRDLVTFDGRRDLFLCEKSGVRLDRMNIIDLQKELNKETDYLFSLNKLAVIANFRIEGSYLRSNNIEYWLHPIAAKQLRPKTAAWDAARLLMVYNEYNQYHDDFLMKGALLLNKIQATK